MGFIIGISAYYHDSSVSLFKNGDLIFACEEEKFTGIKHDSSFPFKTLEYIYKKYNIKKEEIEAVCYYENPYLKLERVVNNIKKQIYKRPIYSIKTFFKIKQNITQIEKNLKDISDNVFYSTHHESHQYYSFYTSNFKDSVCLSVDGVGETDTLSIGLANNYGIEYSSIGKYPHSLGLFYSAMTSFLGFKPNEGEYKLMGLASYGSPQKYIEKVRTLIDFEDNSLKCNMDIFCWDISDKLMFNEKLSTLLDIDPRLTEEEITKEHEDLASAVQERYEELLFKIIENIKKVTDNTNLCLGGGSAYNGTANGKITQKTHINKLWIPVAPSDAGSCIGACIHYLVKNKKLTHRVTKNPFLGPSYNFNDYIRKFKDLKYTKIDDYDQLLKIVAQKIHEGNVIGWFRGKIEFGSRALGNRSILADPTRPEMKSRINKLIKKREGFRPFAPMVIKEKQNIFFDVNDDVPYMNQIVNVREQYSDKLTAVVHIDGTSRIQTIYKNTTMYNLLLEFEKLSGYPILLNTSFNIKDKTMVLTPIDAVETFNTTDLDLLVIDNYIIYK